MKCGESGGVHIQRNNINNVFIYRRPATGTVKYQAPAINAPILLISIIEKEQNLKRK